MRSLLPLLFLACPLMMVFMMRGGHGGHGVDHSGDSDTPADGAARDQRIAALERELSQLRSGQSESLYRRDVGPS